MSKTMVEVQTPSCVVCGRRSILEVEKEALQRFSAGTKAQHAFPAMSAEEREMLITGTHPDCWDELFAGEEDRA